MAFNTFLGELSVLNILCNFQFQRMFGKYEACKMGYLALQGYTNTA